MRAAAKENPTVRSIALLALLSLLTAGASSAAEPTSPPAAPRPQLVLADLAWIAGEWVGDKEGDRIEEVWLPPAAGAMPGLFRWLRGERLIVYEMLAFEQRPEGLVLLLRHFDAGLAPREAAEALIFDLVEASPDSVLFAGRDAAHPIRLGYRRDGADGLVALLELPGDGAMVRQEFVYRRR
jgi:hypothetical protein